MQNYLSQHYPLGMSMIIRKVESTYQTEVGWLENK